MNGFPGFVINEAGIYSAVIAISFTIAVWIWKVGGPKVSAKIEKDENSNLKSIMKDVKLMINKAIGPVNENIAVIKTEIINIKENMK